MIVSIEANIGAGKSTLLKYLKKNVLPSGTYVGYEDLDQWIDFMGYNLLEKCYHGEAFYLQCLIPATRLEYYIKYNFKNIVCERSIFTDEVFQRVWKRKKGLTDIEAALNKKLLETFEYFANKPDLFVYLKTDSNVCLERCKQQARGEESNIDLEFLEMVEEELDVQMVKLPEIAPVLVIDGQLPTKEIAKQIFGEIKRKGFNYTCDRCGYKAFSLGNYKKHLMTKKHLLSNPLLGEEPDLDRHKDDLDPEQLDCI